MESMKVLYAQEEQAPYYLKKSLFLAGPTPRSADIVSWRTSALQILQFLGYDGVVFVPEPRDGVWNSDYIGQVEWEESYLNMADCILFWVPREMTHMPGLTTNIEWGVWHNSGKVVFGAPSEAHHVKYMRYYAEKYSVPSATTLIDTLKLAINMIGDGSVRSYGEQQVPLYIWKTPHFQQWYKAQRAAGNRLDGARVEWTFRMGPKNNLVFFWALKVDVYNRREERRDMTEVVIARPDIATMLMYRRGAHSDDSEVVLIREFRSPASTPDGTVLEVPGGSSFKPAESQLQLAIDEFNEETGLTISSWRVKCHGSRQLVATMSAHKAHLFSVEITQEEFDWLRSQRGIAHGITEENERTYVEIMTIGEVRKNPNIDWSMLGMILDVLS